MHADNFLYIRRIIMTKSELKGLIRSVLKEELLREASEEATYQYSFYFAGTKLDEEKFKQKLIITLKAMKSISMTSAIPEAVEVIVNGLKEGAELKGISVFELGGKSVIVKARKDSGSNTSEVDTSETEVTDETN
jgi:CRISPR/Cas system endoribonuclease Cas6 (RAMP superfamily)